MDESKKGEKKGGKEGRKEMRKEEINDYSFEYYLFKGIIWGGG